jgi:hypothetical protein
MNKLIWRIGKSYEAVIIKQLIKENKTLNANDNLFLMAA